MKEYAYVIEDVQEIFPAVYEVLDAQKKLQARHVFVAIYGPAAAEKLMAKLRRAVEQRMPHACVVCAVAMESIVNGRLTHEGVAVSFTLFRSSETAAWLYDFDAMEPGEAGRAFAEVLASEDDVRAIEFISTDDRSGIDAFFGELAALPEEVAVFGGIAENGTEDMPTIFAGDAACGHGVLAIVFTGEDLHVSVSSSFGWKPLGRPMTITRMKNPFTVQSIDHRPAVDVYQTYLGLSMDEDILTEMLTFPLFLHRNGIALARLPQTSEPDGSVRFAGDFFTGEHVQIAYGDPQEILDTADRMQVGMAAFRPEALYFVSCVARKLLLADDTEQELGMSRYLPSAGFYAYSEFLRRQGEFMTANMTFVTIGMREGEKSAGSLVLPKRISHVDTRTDIMRHLVNFVQQVIGELEDANERYRRLARRDLLTGLLNRGTTDETLGQMVEDAARAQEPLSVLMMDIDDFKGINDTCGHAIGDHALKTIARVLREETRDGFDVPGRMGGDEFLVILSRMDERDAHRVAERIRSHIAELESLPGGRRMTTSIGIASLAPGDTAQELYKRADEALYEVKQGGKNGVKAAKRRK
ncbi:GGDEF domain-containing protein [uncultured Selenomonas sp.]|uniref:sensor domain-containing diguanylate cyclase n=1 Tax=uncultured Selenomonas sp. TaxID=159275 RepID=UPI0025D6D0FA|nr:GGDEF domain-containing protein [uncultured Selenomonas sp.]